MLLRARAWRRLAPALLALSLPLSSPAKPADWVKEIAQLTAADATTPPATGGVVFIGSSSIRLWTTLAADFPQAAPVNRGFGGSELADALFYADHIVLPYAPRVVVLYAGENDLWNGKTPATVAADFRAFRARLHAALPQTRILYLSIKLSPSRIRIAAAVRRANELLAAACAEDPRSTFVDVATPLLAPDGKPRPELFRPDLLHLNPAGYAVWQRVLAPHLAR